MVQCSFWFSSWIPINARLVVPRYRAGRTRPNRSGSTHTQRRRAMQSWPSLASERKPARKEGPCLCSASADTLVAHATGAGGRLVAAMGGMSAMIPINGDEAANKATMNRTLADKLREIAHPLINKIVFDKYMHGPNQYSYAGCAYSICGAACRRCNGGRDICGGPGVDPRLFGVFGN
ncbi:hypothetical protein EXIGLDRAFT_760147 [Exidia glandulosa HHB12029]|uniref:Malate synthase TIM barrel domain-containing protein n=1 Tax=Exidia glandulosa HHB12029 TaxID=1314781 RepID=A0A165PKR8_EXIGL|nr:hypothetical protein EXIGLDRAFT_760147 [Exidia glandulosa HHB12029]